MATVTWNDVIKVSPASTPATVIEMFAPGLNETTEGRTDVRLSVDGTRRGYTMAGIPTRHEYTCESVDRDDYLTLTGWAGTQVVVRDPLGRVLFAMLDEVRAKEVPRADTKVQDLRLRISEVEDGTEV